MLFRLAPTRGWEYNQNRPGSHSAGLLDGVEHLPACSNSSQAKLKSDKINAARVCGVFSGPEGRRPFRYARRLRFYESPLPAQGTCEPMAKPAISSLLSSVKSAGIP